MVYLDKNINKPLYEQLYEELKEEIVTGKLPQNTVLSSVRILAKELQISKNTVDRAYQQLLAEGYIRSVPGSGYYVEDITKDYFEQNSRKKHFSKKEPSEEFYNKYDFLYSSIDTSVFPWNKWKKCIQEALLDEESMQTIPYECNKGNEELRKSLCSFLNKHRGVKCKPEQVIMCPGTQFAVDIITTLLPANQYRLAYEEPGYDAMRNIFINKGYSITSIPVLDDGIDAELLENTNCNLVYMTPSHQFPTGTVTSVKKRKRILDWSRENDAYIIENDYDSEFRYGVVPIPSFQSLDEEDRVIYTGTLSKVMLPSIRCAYLVLPEQLLPRYQEVYQYFNSALPSYHQRALFRFIEEGSLEKHIRRISLINEQKYHVLVGALKKYLKKYIELFEHPAGVHTLIRIPDCKNQNELIEWMKNRSIGIYGTKEYYYQKNRAREDTFLVGFNAMTEEEIVKGCQALGAALKEYMEQKK
ncbi:MAG: PLP-dependent aminotransferase family protein [Lachnospiraceae bacterium]|nr:PLP-dependent aminotransferase family protein [Lachnospiraceae bacterium]